VSLLLAYYRCVTINRPITKRFFLDQKNIQIGVVYSAQCFCKIASTVSNKWLTDDDSNKLSLLSFFLSNKAGEELFRDVFENWDRVMVGVLFFGEMRDLSLPLEILRFRFDGLGLSERDNKSISVVSSE
jgi:hypothetical protein